MAVPLIAVIDYQFKSCILGQKAGLLTTGRSLRKMGCGLHLLQRVEIS